MESASQFVTARLQSELDSAGLFMLQHPSISDQFMTASDAIAIATADLNTFGSQLLPYLEDRRGAKIELESLSVLPRVYFGRSPWFITSASSPDVLARSYGSYYFVHFADADGKVVLSTAVPAKTTDLQVDRGRVVGGGRSGLFTAGVPRGTPATLPMSPEAAAGLAATATGALVDQVPELLLAGPPLAPQWARWRVHLDREVPLRLRDGRLIQSREVYVGHTGELFSPAIEQPDVREIALESSHIRIVARPETPTAFVSVNDN